jgi:hypothetical protein
MGIRFKTPLHLENTMRIQLIDELRMASDELTADARDGIESHNNDPLNQHCKPSMESIEKKLKVAQAIEELLKSYGEYANPDRDPGHVTIKTVVRVKREQVPGLFYDPEDFALHAGKSICDTLRSYDPEVVQSIIQ